MSLTSEAAAPSARGESYAATFARQAPGLPAAAADTLLLPDWRVEDWRKLLSGTTVKRFKASDVLMKHGEVDRALFFIAEGLLEVGVSHFDGVTIAPLARITAGSVVGEQAFFDGLGRSANVWAGTDGVLLRLEYERYQRFAMEEPHLARDFVFAVARVLSTRLRNTTVRVRR